MKYQSLILDTTIESDKKIKLLIENFFKFKEPIQDLNIKVISKLAEKESIGILEVSGINDFAFKKDSLIKLIIIQKAHLLTEEAQNAILKIVEEPPENLILSFATSNPNRLLATILSRCILIKEEDLNEDLKFKEQAENFILASPLERYKIIDTMLTEDISRDDVIKFIESIVRAYAIRQKSINIDAVLKICKSIRNSGNVKLGLDYLVTLM